MQNIKTVFHRYHFNMTVPFQAEEYQKLKDKTLTKLGFKVWDVIVRTQEASEFYDKILNIAEGSIIELETKNLFDDQWNTDPIQGIFDSGFRAFNWVEFQFTNRNIKAGYWLEQTQEMRHILANTYKCRYCGAMHKNPKQKFCDKCLGSRYLTPDDFYLTRTLPVSFIGKIPKVTEEEYNEIITRYKEAQIKANTTRQKEHMLSRAEPNEKAYEKALYIAHQEYYGNKWLIEHGINLEPIYYKHTDMWCWGWSTKVAPELKEWLLSELEGFPYNFEIKFSDNSVFKKVQGE